MSSNYTQYLGAKRCCDLKVQGPQGPQGSQGRSAVGGMGPQGATGAQGYQGATGRGCIGPAGVTGAQGATGPQGATGAQGAEGAAGGAGLILYYNYSVTGGVSPFALQRTTDYTGAATVTLPIGTVSWRLNPTVTNPFTISGGSYQSVIFASAAAGAPTTATIQITSVTDALGATLASISNPVSVLTTATATTPYLLIGNINTGPFNFNTTNNFIDLSLNISGAPVDITFQTPGAYSNINLLTPVLVQGPTGPVGATGATGAQGFQGATGATGAQGFQGDTGAQGFQGDTGATGAQGFQGATGATGAQGFQGATGAQGFQGSTGAQGFQGATGAQGFQGATGATGAQGFQGATGAQGFQGSTGATGAQGFQGATGAQGFQGATGAQGFQGATGAQGATGDLGNDGSNSGIWQYGGTVPAPSTGPVPAQQFLTSTTALAGTSDILISSVSVGVISYNAWFLVLENLIITNGRNGYLQITERGNNNIIGHYVITNISAPLGFGGWLLNLNPFGGNNGSFTTGRNYTISWVADGPQGATGATGAQGFQGATGAQGFQGSTGATGAQGFQGATGAQGFQGDTGAQGFQGATGAQGAQGFQGDTGAQGFQGDTGAQGFQGATGAQGFQGATGSSTPWIPMNGYGSGGTAGYTGIGVTGQDVLIYGNLLVTGGIDPIYLALTPQPNGPQGFVNPLWVDSVNGNALRSEHIYMDNPPSTAYIAIRPDTTNQIILSDGGTPTEIKNIINNSSITMSSTATPFVATIGSNYDMQINSTNNINLLSGANINLVSTNTTGSVVISDSLTAPTSTATLNTSPSIEPSLTLSSANLTSKLTTTTLQFQNVSVLPRRFYQNALAFSVNGSPSGVIYDVATITDMVASTKWNVEVSFLTSSTNNRNVITYQVLDSGSAVVDVNSVLSYTVGGFMTASTRDPNGVPPTGQYISFTDTFEVSPSASGSCKFILTGGTFDGLTWAGQCNVSIVLTYLP